MLSKEIYMIMGLEGYDRYIVIIAIENINKLCKYNNIKAYRIVF